MIFMDKLPTVISCCFCCFLRAGTVMIGIFSFLVGLMFAPNFSHVKGIWEMDSVLSNFGSNTESAIQITLGVLSIMLCVVSALLLVGAFCNIPCLILVYQWGALLYSACVVVLFSILAVFCFFIHTNCYQAGAVMCALIVFNVLITAYFIIVANSLRVSLQYLHNEYEGGV